MQKILKKLMLLAAFSVMPLQLQSSNDDDPCGPCEEWNSASKTCDNVPDNKDCCGGLPIPKGFECCNGNLCNECQYCDEMQGICINHPFGALCDEGVCCGGECIDTNLKDCCHEKPIPLGQACCATDDDCSDCEECKDNYCQSIKQLANCHFKEEFRPTGRRETKNKCYKDPVLRYFYSTRCLNVTGNMICKAEYQVPVQGYEYIAEGWIYYYWVRDADDTEPCRECPPNPAPKKVSARPVCWGPFYEEVENKKFIQCMDYCVDLTIVYPDLRKLRIYI